jgi:hypothetical protein
MARSLSAIALDIKKTWPKVNFAAVPYLKAMSTMTTVDTMYGWEYGDIIVVTFLNNATTWRGEDARRIKAELKQMLEDYNKSK